MSWLWFILALIGIVGTAAIIWWHHPRSRRKKPSRGTEPGRDLTLLDSGLRPTGGSGGGHTRPTLVTRDPQAYAKAMQPKR